MAALGGDSDDLVLNTLIEVTIASIEEERPLFGSILEEPAFWRRHFYRWIKEYLEEEDALRKAQGHAITALSEITGAF
jgi:hypothetical protein